MRIRISLNPLQCNCPMLLPVNSVNQRSPSGPAVMPKGPLPTVGIGNSVTTPAVVMRPILLPTISANQRLPSCPAVINSGEPSAVGTENSVTTPADGSPELITAGQDGNLWFAEIVGNK